MRFEGKALTKDLTKLGRRISKVIILDDCPNNYSNCLANGVKITPWHGER